jgi:hypothetical protein
VSDEPERTGKGPARGYSWAPFAPGNVAAATHGAYAVLALSDRVQAFAARLREAGADHLAEADEPAIAIAALSAVQLACATGAVEEVAEAIERGDDVDEWLGRLESRARLSQDARRWSDTVRKWFDSLGLTPAGRHELEERSLTLIHVHEVQLALSQWARVTGEFVPASRRGEYLAAIGRLAADMPVPAIELPPASDVAEEQA